MASSFAVDIKQMFLNANRLYEEKKFDTAIKEYEHIIQRTRDPAVYYNLANAYFRVNKIGKAILNYERALRLFPRDQDINLNLRFSKKTLNISEQPGLIRSITNFFTSLELFLFVFSINFFFFVLLYLKLIKNFSISFTTLLITFSVLVISFAILYFKISDESAPYAIVIANACEVKSGPGEEYKTELTLNEGKKLLITAQKGGWYAIKIDRHIGWINKDVVEKI